MPEAIATRTVQDCAFMRDASVRPGTLNESERTIEVVVSTGARGLQRPWYGEPFFEELEISEGAIELDRLNRGAAVVNQHRIHGTENQVARVMRAWVADGELRALLKFSAAPSVEDTWIKVREGVVCNFSMGYWVKAYDEIPTEPGETPIMRAVKWEPYEVSLVVVPFDAGAQTRAHGADSTHPIEIRQRSASMPQPTPQDQNQNRAGSEGGAGTQTDPSPAPENPQGGSTGDAGDGQNRSADPSPPASPSPTPPDGGERGAAPAPPPVDLQAERERSAALLGIVRQAGMPEETADAWIRDGVSLEIARERALNAMVARDEETPTRSTHRAQVTDAQRQEVREGMQRALEVRMNLAGSDGNPLVHTDASRNYMHHNLNRMVEDCLRAVGEFRPGMTQDEMFSRAMSTGDFPFLLSDVSNNTLRAAYEEQTHTWLGLSRRNDQANFLPVNRTSMGEAPELEEIGEDGEVTFGKMSEGQERWALMSFGKGLCLTRRAIINDQPGAFARLARGLGNAAFRKVADVVWNLIINNPTMNDGNALFSAAHGNVGASDTLSLANVQALATKMRLQKGPEGLANLNIEPRQLIVPPSLSLEAAQIMAQISPTKHTDVNPYSNSLEFLVTEARLETLAKWFLAAAIANSEMLEHGYLSGNDAPVISTREGWSRDGVDMKVTLDFGAGVIEHRGLGRST